MDNLHINNTAPTRTCLPPPGFSSAPNQVNSYGISIPRNTGKSFLIYKLVYYYLIYLLLLKNNFKLGNHYIITKLG